MDNFRVDMLSGNIFLNNLCIAPCSENDFILVASSLFKKGNIFPADINLTVYSNERVKYGIYFFLVQVWFGNGYLEMLSLDWLEGITQEKGWNSSDLDLIRDKSSLTRFIQKMVGKKPQKTESYKDIFEFDWGSITTVGMRKAMYPKIDIIWNRKN